MRLVVMGLALVAFGCVSVVPVEQAGPQPNQEEVQAALQRWADNNLRDPESAKFRNVNLDGPRKWTNARGTQYGWQITCECNGKNAMGGYVGYRPLSVLRMTDGRVMGNITNP
jgi:hypothetical protein